MENLSINSSVKNWAEFSSSFSGPLSVPFYQKHTLDVAQSLLGKILVVRGNPSYDWEDPRAEVVAGRIIETEAYRADDPASHSARGETPRTAVMFGEPGIAYVYFIYGMYEMLNFVTEPKGSPGAVLIRALEPVYGHSFMKVRRTSQKASGKEVISGKKPFDLTNGPGRLCRALGIQLSDNRQSLMGPRFLVVEDGFRPQSLSKSPRVGIRLGSEALWRFFITDHPFVSRTPQNLKSIKMGCGI